jgi:hypothetical protein
VVHSAHLPSLLSRWQFCLWVISPCGPWGVCLFVCLWLTVVVGHFVAHPAFLLLFSGLIVFAFGPLDRLLEYLYVVVVAAVVVVVVVVFGVVGGGGALQW